MLPWAKPRSRVRRRTVRASLPPSLLYDALHLSVHAQVHAVTVWVRDLTEEGIESNPGPDTSYVFIDANVNGLKTGSAHKIFLRRINTTRARLAKEGKKLAAVFVQEHNFKAEDVNKVHADATYARVIASVSYMPNDRIKGGTAIYIPFDSVETNDKSESAEDTRAHVEASTQASADGAIVSCKAWFGGRRMQLVSAYAPVTAALRKNFFTDCLEGYLDSSTLLGIDANCVPDPALDSRSDANATQNDAGADDLEQITDDAHLEDICRVTYPDKLFFTAHHVTAAATYTTPAKICKRRLDRFYTPFNDDTQWEYSLDPNFIPPPLNRSTSHEAPDHIAQVLIMNPVTATQSKRRPRIIDDVWDMALMQDAVETALKEARSKIASGTSAGDAWEEAKELIRVEALKLSDQIKRKRKAQTQKLEAQLADAQEKIMHEHADASLYEDIATLRKKIHEIKNAHRETSEMTEHFARHKKEALRAGSKEFHRRFKPSNSAQFISKLFEADWTDISNPVKTGATESDPSKLAELATGYYKSLFRRETPDRNAKAACIRMLEELTIEAPAADICGAPITAEEIRTEIESLPRGKSPGPDMIAYAMYISNPHATARILEQVFQEAREKDHLPPTMLQGTISLLFKKNERDDIRNYRPITLLNSDYKILMRVVATRLNKVVTQFTSPICVGEA